MTMHNPPHPGAFIQEVYLEPFSISARQLASSLGVSPSTLSRLLKGDSGISPEPAN
jgi:addiction module HigA family antidote